MIKNEYYVNIRNKSPIINNDTLITKTNCIKLKSVVRENINSLKNIKTNLYNVKKDNINLLIDLKMLKEEYINKSNKGVKARSIFINVKANRFNKMFDHFNIRFNRFINKSSLKTNACTKDSAIVKNRVDACTSKNNLIVKNHADACTNTDGLIVKNHADACANTDYLIAKNVNACTSTDDLFVKNHVDACTNIDDLVKNHADVCTDTDDLVKNHADICTNTDDPVKSNADARTNESKTSANENKPSTKDDDSDDDRDSDDRGDDDDNKLVVIIIIIINQVKIIIKIIRIRNWLIMKNLIKFHLVNFFQITLQR